MKRTLIFNGTIQNKMTLYTIFCVYNLSFFFYYFFNLQSTLFQFVVLFCFHEKGSMIINKINKINKIKSYARWK